MSTGDRLNAYWSQRNLERPQLEAFIARYWQVGLILALVGIAAGLRLWGLGDRAIHHDESIHVKFAWDITQSNQYTHDPVYHGPFQYFGTAATFVLLGASDFTSRVFPALFGIGLVAMPFLLRRQIGTLGAFIAATFFTFSPVLLYFSRFARNDIYIAVFTLAIIIAMWRYLSDRKYGWLIAIGPLLALSFATKEVTYITVAVLLVYMNFLVANDLVDQLRASRKLQPEQIIFAYVVILPTAWLIVAVWPLIGGLRERWAFQEMPAAGGLLIITGTLALPQFAAGIQKFPEIVDRIPAIGDNLVSWFNLDALADRTPEGQTGGSQLRADERVLRQVTVLLAIAGTAAVGLRWNWRIWGAAAAAFYIPFFLLHTGFFTNGGDIWNVYTFLTPQGGGFFHAAGEFWRGDGGFWSGSWGSLDYWLSQQGVERGSQPDYYYFVLLPAYEFLPLIFGLGGALFYAFRGKLEQKLLAASALLLITVLSLLSDDFPLVGSIRIEAAFIIAIGTALILPIEGFTKFLIFWTLAILFSLTVAGEKMPWLSVHLALPLGLLAAKILDDILSRIDIRATVATVEQENLDADEDGVPKADGQAIAWDRLAPLIAGGVIALLAAVVFLAVGPASLLSVFAWFLSAVALFVVLWVASNVSWQAAGQVAVVSLFAALMVFTIRTGVVAAFDEGDEGGTPPEILIYAQGSPQLSSIRDDIERLGRESGLGRDLRIVIDNSNGTNIWPWPWYLRDYGNVAYTAVDDSFEPEPGSVILLASSNRAVLEPFLDQYQEGIPYTHMWWFPERYKNLDAAGFLGDALTGEFVSTWTTYFIDRELFNLVDGERQAVETGPDRIAYFPLEFPASVTGSNGLPVDPPPPPPPTGPSVLLDGDLQTLIGTAGDGDGEFSQPAGLALDSEGNLYVVDTLNQRIQKFGPDGDFIDEVGREGSDAGEFADPNAQDSQFAPDGPWGVAVDSDGNVYVADTWNHRIQKYDADLELVEDWIIDGLFGPRDIAITGDGNLLIVDTGNKRIMEYTPDGQLVQEHGGAGSGPGEFNEPTSISITSDGDIYVADYWNQRIQHFDAEFAYIDEIAMPTWGSTGVTDRAYIFAFDTGTLLATDPTSGRIIVFDESGTEIAAWRLIEGESRLIGIVADSSGNVYISDGLASEVRLIPLLSLLIGS